MVIYRYSQGVKITYFIDSSVVVRLLEMHQVTSITAADLPGVKVRACLAVELHAPTVVLAVAAVRGAVWTQGGDFSRFATLLNRIFTIHLPPHLTSDIYP